MLVHSARNMTIAGIACAAVLCTGITVHAQQAVPETILPDAPLPTLATNQPPSTTPSPPAQNPQQGTGPSLGDLGLTPTETQGNAREQALLDKRTHMLKLHQRWGLYTTIPLAAALLSGGGATAKRGDYTNTASRDLHVAFGSTAVIMYGITASYAIRAPKISHETARGGIKWHKYLIYIHGPGMVLTPILGAMAFNQINNGQKVHGIASAHGAVAIATAASYGAAIVAVSWPIHIGFGSARKQTAP